MRLLIYTVSVIGVLTFLWYCFLLVESIRVDWAKSVAALLRKDLTIPELERIQQQNKTIIRTIFLRLSPDKQVFIGICSANIVSMLFLSLALYFAPILILPFTFCVTLFTFCGIIFIVRRYSEYSNSKETSDGYNFVDSLNPKRRLVLGATLYSGLILILLCLI